MASKEAMEALMRIEGFRSLNSDIETIINKSEAVKKAKKDNPNKLDPKQKKELSEEEKELKSKRKQIQEKLIKFATRVPIFMYLTDFREQSLKHVITQLEPGLFKKVTGLDVKDFELLLKLNVFNPVLMNDAIYKFKRYEDSSLSYTGIDKHEGEDIGGWDTVIKRSEYEKLFYNQQATMAAPVVAADDVPEQPYVVYEDEDEDEEIPEPVKPKEKKAKKEKPVNPRKASPVTTYYATPSKPAASSSITTSFGAKPAAAPVKPVETKPKMDLTWVQVGVIVKHKSFGEGMVLEISNGLITVSFGKAEKKFQYPFAFENGFLSKI